MAANSTPSDKQVDMVSLKVLVDKDENKVLFAEADKDFVDVLLSFLTMPLGTIARLVAKESNMQPVKVGSLSSLYESVTHIEEKHLWTPTCKEMLLQPRNSLEAHCKEVKLNIDDTDLTKYFICNNWDCIFKKQNGTGNLLSTFRNKKCHCGKLLNRVVNPENMISRNGFVKETANFIITDDLYITPNVFGESVNLFQKLGIEDMEAVEELTVEITKKEVVDLLKFSLISKTPLTDFILEREKYLDKLTPINEEYLCEDGEVPSDERRQMVLKVQLQKSNGKILFWEAQEDFADFVFSFLTFPLGGVVHMLEGFSSLSCIDKLYRSVTELSSDRYLKSQVLKDKLANPLCAPQFNLGNQILPIGAERLPVFYCRPYDYDARNVTLVTSPRSPYRDHGKLDVPFSFVDPKSSTGESSGPGGFVKGPSMYMVVDDLVVTPMSAISAFSYLNRLKVSLSDLEEKVISIGVKECLGILKASLTSTSALTYALKHLIKTINEQN